MRVVITGVASPRGRLVARHLVALGHEVIGVDQEPWPDVPAAIALHAIDHRKRSFDELMRHGPYDAIVHLAVHAGFRLDQATRHRLNLEGTGKVIQSAVEHGVPKLVVASHAVVYGALPDNPLFMTEAAPPAVGRASPEMQDLVTADLLSTAAMWQHPEVAISVLRPVHSVGPTSRDVVAALLRRGRFPTVWGYDPMIQVIHEEDLARAFGCAVTARLRGPYNVTGAGELPLSVLIHEAGAKRVALPEVLFHFVRGGVGLERVPPGAVQFLKHPCLVDGTRFTSATDFKPTHTLTETIRSVRRPTP